jgi:glycosyltransferase involved in cell wall biosynthesis
MGRKPLRILQVMECTIGGTRRHIRELASGLAGRGHRVMAVCSAERDPTFREDMACMGDAGVKVVELPLVRPIAPWTDGRHLAFLYRFLRKNPCDLIHTHSSKAGVLGRVASLAAGAAPRVHTPHTFAFSFAGEFSPLKRRLYLTIERWLGRRTHRLVNVSESEHREAIDLGIAPPDRMVVVENGINPWPYRWAEPPEPGACLFGEGKRAPRLGTVGLLNAAKGHDVLLSAFARLLDRFPDAGLAIVGEGELRGSLEGRIADLGLKDRARLVGYRREVPSLLKELDLFVLPSRWEGMPYVLMEAMAAGVPVVATDVNGSRDIVVHGETGLIVPPGDVDALAAACALVLDDPQKHAAMVRAGLRRVMGRYTVEKMLDGIEAVYQGAVEEAGRG